jgi:predicted RNA-binding Zn-ribbon protein involved in translation (DUF1610 family)
MSSAVYSVKFQCDKCGAVGEIETPYVYGPEAELLHYHAPNGWISIQFGHPKMSNMVLHYCPECNKATLALLDDPWT